ncbi:MULTISPECIES: DMT family transporter [Rhizobium/Agrobacterium group]|uniref:DMT family transporter n=1 Tax=Agrobacterium salinitolerans TaxID=1183413 RepID=A0A4Z1QR23_9HYPH|nr:MULTISPECIES: DMT family transporter [Rhizobium/Agrobacterium group]NTF52696.1 hypothetical protein [Rhizobium rhizogenes]NTF65715.1 hypothetical protein [Rhizobium rhizogenes]NTF97757.1 hypothetical protein [Rhizobium rhizogenes]NTG11842.1 hypothetical protein [Rhizobium rhizogenes]NTG97063.1 hypothetical protein [Rhizobium rhizogenes]
MAAFERWIDFEPIVSCLARIAHATVTVTAVIVRVALRRNNPAGNGVSPAPLWAYLGEVSGALMVILASTSVDSPIGLSGTRALGLAGQVVFILVADICGLFGLPRSLTDARDLIVLGLILAGSPR